MFKDMNLQKQCEINYDDELKEKKTYMLKRHKQNLYIIVLH